MKSLLKSINYILLLLSENKNVLIVHLGSVNIQIVHCRNM